MTVRRIYCLLAVLCLACAFCACEAPIAEPLATQGSESSPAPEVLEPQSEPMPQLVISEVMADNETYFQQCFADWIEVFNPTDQAAELSDYYLSKDEYHPYQCRLPAGTLEAGALVVLVCGRDVPFNLAKEGGSLMLSMAGDVFADAVQYPALLPDQAYAADGPCDFATPGFANTAEGYAQYRKTLPMTLAFSEVLSKNGGAYAVGGALPDAIELVNLTDAPISLADYYLSDTKDALTLYQLPEVTLLPQEVYVLPADGGTSGNGAPFKVSSEGEALYLTHANGLVADALLVPPLEANVSYGRVGEGYAFFQPPTIGKANEAGRTTPLAAPQASLSPGMYGKALAVTLSGEGEIYYTLNNQQPSKTRGTLYDGTPIAIASTCSVRAIAYDGEAASATATFSYFINEPTYALPVLKLTAPSGTITGSGSIYQNYLGSREVRANLALFVDGHEEFSVNCGVSMFGAGSRVLAKKSFKIRFRKTYGEGALEYELFEGLGVACFDALVLRSGSEDQARAFFRDELTTALVGQSDMDTLYVQAYRPVNLYINEEYFGIYYIREWVREGYVAAHLNVSEESVSIIEGWDYAIRGTAESWFEALEYCRKHGDLSDDAMCAYVLARIDEQSLTDYCIARAYGGDHDFANIRHIRSSEGDGKWRVVFFDLDWAFCNPPANNPFYVLLGERKNLRGHNNIIMRALLTNASVRARFLARVGHELATTFATENVLALIDAMERELEADMPYECARWHRSMANWHAQVQKLRDFANNGRGRAADRTGLLAQDAITTFDMTDEEVERYFGGVKME